MQCSRFQMRVLKRYDGSALTGAGAGAGAGVAVVVVVLT